MVLSFPSPRFQCVRVDVYILDFFTTQVSLFVCVCTYIAGHVGINCVRLPECECACSFSGVQLWCVCSY